MADPFQHHSTGLTSPPTRHGLVTPSDTVDLDPKPKCLLALSSGTVSIMDDAGVVVPYPVTAGDRLDFRAKRVMATGTTSGIQIAWQSY
ncbi:hypothetical protein DWF04_000045, partial [Cereibacter sphaeroides f. sp. denitrificans]|nr:hypothetical protein DWF04_16040 [Cereibacter sphaeroides f. sp. denitrificans]